ncbi:hypothetical protein F4823DRAFT_565252 [Ustulina deusta]|nr:hypothetical protein F4823DRAFT_565252 [Ustulina deusta]
MKLILVLMSFPIASLAWQNIWHWREKIGGFLSNPLRQSRVPQFILDARHPWIIENLSKLESLPDAESYLCFPSKESTTDTGGEKSSEGENGLDLPPDLFDYLKIDNSRWGIDNPGWPDALLRAREIARCPAALSQVKTFKLGIYVLDSEPSGSHMSIPEPLQPPTKVLDLFADVLGNMTSLETLQWSIPPPCARYFEERFTDRGLVLSSVKRLEPSAMNHFLVPMCSNITALEYGGDWMSRSDLNRSEDPESLLLQAAMFAPKLTRFGMTARLGWTELMIQDLVSGYMPGLESLGLRGCLGDQYTYSPYVTSDGSALKEILQLLSSLHNLTHLDLPGAVQLDVGWDGGPFCGNAYFGPGGTEYAREVYREGLEATERVAALVVEALPRLTSFNVGDDQANITRYENGTLRACFPWTGRMEEWVMEVLPGGPDGPDEY